MRIKQIILLALLMCFSLTNVVASESELPEFSKAGYYEIKNSGRTVYNFNIGWRFYKGENEHAFKREFNDTDWGIVNCPHGLELISTESSGSNNYQGVAWYRKKFDVKQDLKGKLSKLYFEGVMGKCKVWLNGEFVAEHYGGYLPFVIDITDKIIHGEENIVALRVDNSDDPDYPPGKAQAQLDFTYFGGIYRDVWMLVTNPIYVTSPIEEDKVAGAGIFTHVNIDNQMNAQVLTKVDIKNEG